MELLCRVTLRLYVHPHAALVFADKEGIAEWKESRRRVLEAILNHDEELAQFEAERYRRVVLARLGQ